MQALLLFCGLVGLQIKGLYREFANLERIAVRDPYRGKGLGNKPTKFMLSVAKEQGFKKYKVHAQVYLAEFYRKHGFEVAGDMFKEAGIDHYLMIRNDSG